MAIDEIRTYLADTLRGLQDGSVSIGKAQATARVIGQQLASIRTELVYRKARGEKPVLSDIFHG